MALSKKITRSLIFAAFSVALAIPGVARAQDSGTHVNGMTGNAEEGKRDYRRWCVGCHGERGDGKGENANYVVGPYNGFQYSSPLPRNFTLGLFKCRSTPSGTLPVDNDLYDTISRGIFTTYMPTWLPLTPKTRVDLIAYVKTFSPRFKDEKPGDPIKIPPETPDTPESRERGKTLYHTTLKCFECHGNEGRGDGPSASTLRDNLGNPIPPFDFTEGTRFKCGATNEDLYRIFMTGLDGTPMPSWADFVDPNQAWDLVHYLRTLMVHYHPQRAEAKQPKSKKG
jgi:mono/diheme cytochrome c family protein